MIGSGRKRVAKTVLGSKKLVIKPLTRQPSLPDTFEAETWAKLREAVVAVHGMTAVQYSREDLYRGVEDMCVHKMGASLYDKLQTVCATHITALVADLAGKTLDGAAFLTLVENMWTNHCRQMIIIRSIFLYLDRTYALQTTGVKSLWDLGLALLRDQLNAHEGVLNKLLTEMLNAVHRERNGETVNRPQLSSLTRMFTSLAMYDVFERAFLDASTTFYKAEAARFMAEAPVSAYLDMVDRRLGEESQRVVSYLDPVTQRPLLALLDVQLVQEHATALLQKGFVQLCDSADAGALSRMYTLYQRVQRAAEMRAHFAEYASAKGMAIVSDAEKDKEMVASLLTLKDALDRLVQSCFASDADFAAAVKQAFQKCVNSRGSRPAELIAKYVDMKLRTGSRGSSETEVEAQLQRVMILFRAVHGKDTFEAFYKKDLAKRLLLGKSADADLEKSMLSKLKAECGSGFTAKLEGMFKDVELSKDFMAEFNRSRAPDSAPRLDMFVHTLTTTYWPPYPPMELTLPPQLAAPQKEFTAFYADKYREKRVLTWQHSLGHCLLRAFFPSGRKELSVSLFQTIVLLLFNQKLAWSFKDIKTASEIEDGELRRTLQSLACGKVRVIVKRPKSKEVNDDDVFHFNADFKAKLLRLKINSIQMKETKAEVAATHERVLQDRQYQIDAAIVRTMKTRKTLAHQQLIAELYSQLKFPAQVADLKKRIMSLIDREYLERDDEDSMTYHYVA